MYGRNVLNAQSLEVYLLVTALKVCVVNGQMTKESSK